MKEGNSRVIVAKKIMNQKDRRQRVSYMDVLTKVKGIQIRHRMDMISYHTSREQWGNGVLRNNVRGRKRATKQQELADIAQHCSERKGRE